MMEYLSNENDFFFFAILLLFCLYFLTQFLICKAIQTNELSTFRLKVTQIVKLVI